MWFFLAPGRVILWLDYHFPRKGDVLASARRKDNRIVQFLYSLGFWAAALFIGVGLVNKQLGGSGPTSELQAASSVEQTTSTATSSAFDRVPGQLTSAPPAADGPSFDCAAAHLPIEIAICANPRVGQLEGAMTRIYEDLLARMASQNAHMLRLDMKVWLKQLLDECNIPKEGQFTSLQASQATPCLTRMYDLRIRELASKE
jgi:uncharacterized protein YecT (DUF1311 family)